MTKKHFKLIAMMIRKRTSPDGLTIYKDSLVSDLCIIFDNLNPKFNEEMFREACYEREVSKS